ncbi:type II toxin-antitoxin system RelE/ParE family toxin [Patescibacteria group bacterium]|nr:type II toxin-antitoxin system RelE/ParE family toxin [Patescibacteria group bacterium]
MKLFVSKTASKQLLKMPHNIREKIEIEVEKLSGNPYSQKTRKLSGRSGYRLRIGDYRVLYSINNKPKRITILSVQHRKDAYRRM